MFVERESLSNRGKTRQPSSSRALYVSRSSPPKTLLAFVCVHLVLLCAGGQYSNLMVQCKSMGIWDKWEQVLDMYRDVNELFGDIIKVSANVPPMSPNIDCGPDRRNVDPRLFLAVVGLPAAAQKYDLSRFAYALASLRAFRSFRAGLAHHAQHTQVLYGRRSTTPP